MKLHRTVLPLTITIAALALPGSTRAAPKVDETMECLLGIFGEPGTTDGCSLTVVTDASKAELEKKPHATFRLEIRKTATNADLKTLAKVPWLEQLRFESNEQIDDLSALKVLKKLRRLDISNLALLKSLAFLSSLPNLEKLEMWDVQVADLSVLKGLTKLTHLTLPQDAKDGSAIVELTGLVELSCHGLDKLAPLSKLTKLEYLRASPDEEPSTSALAGMTAMKTLRLTGSRKLADLSGLKGMTSLDSVEIGMTVVSDISALAGATKLRYLHLDETKVASLAPLAKLEGLEEVDAGKTLVKDFSPLKASAKKLKTLYVPDGTPPAAVAMLLKENPQLKVYGLKK